jgi:hypothetical protein
MRGPRISLVAGPDLSLMIFQAAPPSIKVVRHPSVLLRVHSASTDPRRPIPFPGMQFVKRRLVLGRPGNDLLSRVLRHSTIGAEEFNGRVRDGIGFFSSSLKSPDRRRTNRQGSQRAPPGTFHKAPSQRSFFQPQHSRDRKIPQGRPAAADHSANSQGNARSRRRLRPTFKP